MNNKLFKVNFKNFILKSLNALLDDTTNVFVLQKDIKHYFQLNLVTQEEYYEIKVIKMLKDYHDLKNGELYVILKCYNTSNEDILQVAPINDLESKHLINLDKEITHFEKVVL